MTGSSGLFVGRAAELAAVREALRAAASGRGGTVLVAGEPGVGKTRLVEEAVQRHEGALVWATCSADSGVPPFWPWVQVLRTCADAGALRRAGPAAVDVPLLLQSWPDVDGVDGVDAVDAPSRFRLFDGVASVLAAAAARAPLVVVLDDLQWADEASLRLLQAVARTVRRLPLLLVGTYRDTELAPGHPLLAVLPDLARAGQHLALAGLAPQELGALVRSVATPGADLDDSVLGALHVQTGGNPFFARELVRLLDADGRLADAGVREPRVVPGGVRAVVGRRLARLPQPTCDVLSWAALLGATFDLALLGEASGQPADVVLDHLEPAVVARLLAPAGTGRWRFVHDLVRESLLASLGLAERAARHRALGRVLATTAGEDADAVARVADHLLAGAAGEQVQDAVRWAVRAAERASAVLAPEDAARWYSRALEVRRAVVRGDGEETDLLLRLGGARLDAGDPAAAREAFAAAAALARARGDPEQLAAAALGPGAGPGGFEVPLFDQVQIDLLEEALRALPPDDTPLRAWVLARLSVALAFVGSGHRRCRLAEAAMATARRADDGAALAHALAAWCDAHSGPDDTDRRLTAAEEVVVLSAGPGRRPLELLGRRLRVVALLERGRLADAAAEVDAFARVADALRQPLYQWYAPLWRSTLAMTTGDLAAAARWGDEAERVGALAQSENARVLAAVQRFVRLRHEGRFADAAGVIGQLLPDVPDIAAPASVAGSLLIGDVVRGDLDRAARRADRLAGDGLTAPRADSEWLPDLAQLADAAAVLEHRGLAALLHEALEPYATTFVVEGIGAAVCGATAHYLALTADVLGRAEEATRWAALAAELHRGAGLLVPPPPLRDPAALRRAPAVPQAAVLRHEGGVWAVSYAGATVRVRDSKGLHDLAVLLRAPGVAVHVTELTGVPAATTAEDLDRTAVAAYRRRLRELEDDLAAAEGDHDAARAERVRAERDFLVDELSGALGLGGRRRRTGDPVERARKAVSARVRDSIARLGEVHPRLGRHLAGAVRTGTWCSYQPEQPVRWES